MISHEYKCIFIHIQRTAGTSIENWIVGKDWWQIDKGTKHLLASQAKKKYSKYWDKYFKFSFVRNPWDRMVSCLIFPKYFGISYADGILNFDGYKNKYGYPIIVENDVRFSDRKKLLSKKHKKNSVYLNILDEKLDYIGKFENLEKDTTYIRKVLGIEKPFKLEERSAFSTSNLQKLLDRNSTLRRTRAYLRSNILGWDIGYIMKLKRKRYRKFYNKETRAAVASMYKKGIETFKYKF